VQDATLEDLAQYLGMAKQEIRVIPYVVMHEFEALLFSDCASFAEGIGRKELGGEFQKIRDQFATPGEINDSAQTTPSKRVEKLVPGYQKPFLGDLAALEIGLTRMRVECPRFGLWVGRLESIVGAA
jgi:hypothetical protein